MNRYVVRSLGGYAINPSEAHYLLARDGPKYSVEWLVLDSCWNYEVVASFTRKNAEQLAHKLARELNVDERRWEVQARLDDRDRGRPWPTNHS